MRGCAFVIVLVAMLAGCHAPVRQELKPNYTWAPKPSATADATTDTVARDVSATLARNAQSIAEATARNESAARQREQQQKAARGAVPAHQHQAGAHRCWFCDTYGTPTAANPNPRSRACMGPHDGSYANSTASAALANGAAGF